MPDLPALPAHIKVIYQDYAQMMDRVTAIGRRCGLNSAAVMLVAFIGDRELSPAQIKAEDMVGASNLSYNLHLLEGRGLLIRPDGSRDRRCRYVKLTDTGLRLCAKVRTELNARISRATHMEDA